MRSRVWRLRFAALLAAGSFAVHQLRFLLAYGSHSSATLAHQGHGYLTVVAPLVIGALMLAIAEFTVGLVRARSTESAPSLPRIWALSSFVLIAVYCAQELTEGALAPGHSAGLAGVFGGGGWLALPLAAAAGLAVALMMRGAFTVVAIVAHRRRLPRPQLRLLSDGPPPDAPAPAGGRLLVCVARPRAPPLPSA